MNQYRKAFAFYLALWLVLALAPAACAVVHDNGIDKLYSAVRRFRDGVSGSVRADEPVEKTMSGPPPLPFLEPANPLPATSAQQTPPLALRKLEGD